MRTLHVQVMQDDGWYVAQGLEDSAVITQGRSLDEIVSNVMEVLELLHGSNDVQIELILPEKLKPMKPRGGRKKERKLAGAGR